MFLRTVVLTCLLVGSVSSVCSAKPQPVVVCPPEASIEEALAGKEIRRYVYLRTGELLPVVQATERDAIIVSRQDRPIVKPFSIGKIGPQHYAVKTISQGARRVVLVVGSDDIGGIQTVINWEGHNALLGIEKIVPELTEMLGGPLPDEAAIPAQYQGEPRLIVPTVRSLLEKGETLNLKVIVLDNQRPQEAALYWKPLDAKEDYRKVPLEHVDRAVHTVSLRAVEGDIEYNIRATTVDGTKLIWPATAPIVNQTVVVMP